MPSMKKHLLFLLALVYHSVSNAQPGSYVTDLKALRNIIQKTPSYRSQILKGKLKAFENSYTCLLLYCLVQNGPRPMAEMQ